MQKSYRTFWIVSAGLILASAFSLLQYKVNSMEKEKRRLSAQIKEGETRIKILSAEVARLSSISRIRAQADRLLPNFKPVRSSDFKDANAIPLRTDHER